VPSRRRLSLAHLAFPLDNELAEFALTDNLAGHHTSCGTPSLIAMDCSDTQNAAANSDALVTPLSIN
jgi:hypothetical protein